MNVAHLLTEAAKDRPHHIALPFEDRAFTVATGRGTGSIVRPAGE
jgi:hypothetical protein